MKDAIAVACPYFLLSASDTSSFARLQLSTHRSAFMPQELPSAPRPLQSCISPSGAKQGKHLPARNLKMRKRRRMQVVWLPFFGRIFHYGSAKTERFNVNADFPRQYCSANWTNRRNR